VISGAFNNKSVHFVGVIIVWYVDTFNRICIHGAHCCEICKLTVDWHAETKQFFIEAPVWSELRRAETVFVMPFSFQTNMREYCGDLMGIAGDAICFTKLGFRRCFRQRERRWAKCMNS
jgi:hypothetical protein